MLFYKHIYYGKKLEYSGPNSSLRTSFSSSSIPKEKCTHFPRASLLICSTRRCTARATRMVSRYLSSSFDLRYLMRSTSTSQEMLSDELSPPSLLSSTEVVPFSIPLERDKAAGGAWMEAARERNGGACCCCSCRADGLSPGL